jgi:hypothetical protein
LRPPVEACFSVEGLESVEVAKLTPAKARERKVAILGDPNPQGLASSTSCATEGRVRDLADLPFAMIPTASALSVAAGARNHLMANRSLEFCFETQT